MAFTNFYLIAGGAGSADINAGSSIGAAQVTTTNGNWNSGTGAFVASGGTPFASTVVGDYASVYVDGATVTTFVGKVTVVTDSTHITVDVSSIKYGTAPSTNATARSCTINGSWATEQVLAGGGLATFTMPQSTKINIKGNLTLAASRTVSMNGAATAPVWFSGYNTNPGDLDNDRTNSLAKPIWTVSAGNVLTCNGTLHLWSGLSIIGNRSGTVWQFSGNFGMISRCRSENQSSNAAALALSTANNQVVCYSWFKTPTTATTTGVINAGGNGTFIGCVADTGGIAGWNLGGVCTFIDCICLNNVGAGILTATQRIIAINCTFYACTVDGIKWTGTPGNASAVIGCIFSGINGGAAITNGINNASGTNTDNVYRACNDYYNVTNTEVGMGDSPSFFGQTESSFPLTSSTDMTPIAGSNALANGFPGIFENETFNSYLNIGAIMQAATSGSGGSAVAIFGG